MQPHLPLLILELHSWMCNSRPEKGREKEAWSRKGEKDAGMGQEIETAIVYITVQRFLHDEMGNLRSHEVTKPSWIGIILPGGYWVCNVSTQSPDLGSYSFPPLDSQRRSRMPSLSLSPLLSTKI